MVDLEKPLYIFIALFATIWLCTVVRVQLFHNGSYAGLKEKIAALILGENMWTPLGPSMLVEKAAEHTIEYTFHMDELNNDVVGQAIIAIIEHSHYSSLPLFVTEADLLEYWMKGKISNRPIGTWMLFARHYLNDLERASQDSRQVWQMDSQTEALQREIMKWIHHHPCQKTFIVAKQPV